MLKRFTKVKFGRGGRNTVCLSALPMEWILRFLRRRIFSSTHQMEFFQQETDRLFHTIHETVTKGVSNSLLVIGRPGSGKSLLLREVINKVKSMKNVSGNFIDVYINGLIHTDDRAALNAIAKQLHRACSAVPEMLLFDEEDASDVDNISSNEPSRSFSEQLRWLLNLLTSGNTSNKTVLVVVEEFDRFAAHRNQALLYNLLDCCQSGGVPLCVVGLTCRLDIMEMLEKRVKSRFSHQQLHLLPVASPLTACCETSEEGGEESGGPRPFERYCHIAASLLKLRLDELDSFLTVSQPQCTGAYSQPSKRKLQEAITSWNAHIDSFFEDDLVSDCLRQVWEVFTSISKLRNFVALLIAPLGGSKVSLETQDFINVVSRLRQDAKTALLPSLSVLELILLTTMVKLHEINSGQPLNFEVVFHEYTRFCRTNCIGYLYEKAVVAKALDNLVDLELVVCGREAAAVASTGGVGLTAGSRSTRKAPVASVPCQLRNYQPIACFVNSILLTACLDAYPNCPVELCQWAHSRTL
ncbi:origin recognition complex subunit 4 [Sparganum proliferum]